MGKFDGKVAIITGASSGIGEATAVAFAKEGAKVTISGRNETNLGVTASKCKKAGAEVLEVVADLSKFELLEPIIKKTVEKFGQLDILVNNAGFGNMGPLEKLEFDLYENIMNTNLRAPVFLSKFALPHLKKTKGCIVNVSSLAGVKATPGHIVYSITKAGMDHLTRCLAAECSSFGVRVNSVNPAVVKTKFGENLKVPKEVLEKGMKEVLATQPLGIIGSDQIAEGILFLSSSSMTTAVNLPISGGVPFS